MILIDLTSDTPVITNMKRKAPTDEKSAKICVKKPKLDKESDVIWFNSKSKEFRKLSNFYGDSEFEYHKKKFIHPSQTVPKLFDKLLNECKKGREHFVSVLKEIMPKKKWTEKKENYWMSNGEPIYGIVAKVVMNMIKRINLRKTGFKQDIIVLTDIANKRQIKLRNSHLKIDEDSYIKAMKHALSVKYKKPEYRELLLSTGNAVLHELATRGSLHGTWCLNRKTMTGSDLLGKMLMEHRELIRQNKD